MEKKIKRALAVSGGGALGAFGGGKIQYLCQDQGRDYDLFVCTSTGSLLAPLASIGDFDRLHKAYTTVNQKDIFDINPFTKKGNINILNAIWRMICGKKTLGESNNLRKRISEYFTEDDYKKSLELKKEIVATTVNILESKIEYKSSITSGMTYNDMGDWLWASACAPIFMTLVKKDGLEYVDGGIMEHIPIQYAIDNGAEEIDVIIHRTEKYDESPKPKIKNILEFFGLIVDTMLKQVSTDNVIIPNLEAKEKDVIINLYYLPYKLTDNSLLFDEETMKKWWDLGRNGVENESHCKSITLKKKKKIK